MWDQPRSPFSTYCAILNAQMEARNRVSRAVVREQLSHLVLSEPLMDQAGVAVNRGRAVLLLGHPGRRLFDMSAPGTLLVTHEQHAERVAALAWSPDGTRSAP